MDILNYHSKLINQYKDYIQSFVQIKDQAIANFVEDKINEGLLWPEPLIQFNPTFEKGRSIDELIREHNLHPGLKDILIYPLFKHQEKALLLGSSNSEFIVTSGTGSGKSLTYIATVLNHVLKQGDSAKEKVQAVIVYPMNALINSQFGELQKFQISYLERAAAVEIDRAGKTPNEVIRELEGLTDARFPLTFAQYTGQEDDNQRDRLEKDPPHIILTNYMMLELMMTRGGRDVQIRKNILDNLRFLIFDELHTYRGRQGSDVSLLIRRIKAAALTEKVICIGTSATMVSGDEVTLAQQRQEVARFASKIFGTNLSEEQVVSEFLTRSLSGGATSLYELQDAVRLPIDRSGDFEAFEKHVTANWIEEHVALRLKEGILVRRKPVTIRAIGRLLADATDLEDSVCLNHIHSLLNWANQLNSRARKGYYLPYRLHQFIAQTGSVYSTLGDQQSRRLYLDAGLYADDKDTMLFPLVFSRASGHEFYSVKLDYKNSRIVPQEFYDVVEETEEGLISDEGYIFIQHKEDEELVWDIERDKAELPESWFGPLRKDGTQKLKSEQEAKLPKKIYFDKQGNFSFNQLLDFEGWFILSPLAIDPTSGLIFESQAGEWTKVMKLGGEGRSTATTVLSFETIKLLDTFHESAERQKLLSFTDNRQDASLQAGHFNDFVKVGQLRAAIVQALQSGLELDYSTIADRVFKCLDLKQEQYARQPAFFPGPKKENEDAFKDLIMYRLLQDLKRSWRVVLPNLEQCGLLSISYKHLAASVNEDTLWKGNELLNLMQPDDRAEFLIQIFDFFRKAYALNFSMLEPALIVQNAKRIREKLKNPWTLDEGDKLDPPSYIRLEKLAYPGNPFRTESVGSRSIFARYIKKVASKYGLEPRNRLEYESLTYALFDFLHRDAGWLSVKYAKSENNLQVPIYQLNADNLLWLLGNKENLHVDLIRMRSYKPVKLKPNHYFQRFYETNFHDLKPIRGSEHTGQIASESRKLRETDFREGKISALYCSPTMELGIDIADLSIVHMRNVPPSPANYAQRSGRAGRSGQAALVMVYCSNFSAHDRHYFKHMIEMVSGEVTAPRIDLINQELLLSHLHACILATRQLSNLKDSLGELVETSDLENLPLKHEVSELLEVKDKEKMEIRSMFKKIIGDSYFINELEYRNPSWFNDSWISLHIELFASAFDNALDRWRSLYKAAQQQVRQQTSIIENRVYADDHEKKRDAERSLKLAVKQRELLLNKSAEPSQMGKNREQTEFYPYRYLAAEGFLPGYNFTRMPIRSYMETEDQGGEFISRPRFVALSEFGPRNIIYHDGSKYRVDRLVLTEAELKLEKAKISPATGYFLYDDQYGYEVDPITGDPLQLDTGRHLHTTLIEMTETRAREMQRITCQEEERTRKGYDIQTHFAVDGGFQNTTEAVVKTDGEALLHIHYMPACRIFKINLKWRTAREDGFTINLNTGYWQNKKQRDENAGKEEIRDVKLFTSDTANAIYIQPIRALALKGGSHGVITLMFAVKRAIENYFQVESNEIGATVMGSEDAPNILIYEAAEGSLGVLSQVIDNPKIYSALMKEAYHICFFVGGIEQTGEVIPATYNDLLSYYNQYYHWVFRRN